MTTTQTDPRSHSKVTDRAGNKLLPGDRVRIVDTTPGMGYMRDGEHQSSSGWICVVEFSMMGLSVHLEDDPTFRFCTNSKEIELVPVDGPIPEIVVHPEPSSADDVTITEQYVYTSYRVGAHHGYATYWPKTKTWDVSYRSADGMRNVEGISFDAPNDENGAWAVWSAHREA